MRPDQILHPRPEGLWCPEGRFFIDPSQPVDRAVVTHGHADHARAGHGAVLATTETLAIMAERYGPDFAGTTQALAYGERVRIGRAEVSLAPAGHVLGSAQATVRQDGLTITASGDYKRRRDPTCAPFEPVPSDVFITEATFGLPVFRHPPDGQEIERLLRSVAQFPERAHLVGAYALGKAQRIIRLLREAGYDETIYVHGALDRLNRLYEHFGVRLGQLEAATGSKADFAGRIVIAPPSAVADRWSRRFPDPIVAFASGWMSVRARARQRGVELPLILSDHADWDELTDTLTELSPSEIWITHGRDDALRRWAELNGLKARALHLVGYEDEDDD
ncbi:ligase-associated DNA damage response exonuclease [Brevundimonas faecalis]|uniref:ligase-associated DNA damage response exonuclease n=1 Tax=Brevundimonas faecalis TaxID=947378 RepID=UPI00360F704B